VLLGGDGKVLLDRTAFPNDFSTKHVDKSVGQLAGNPGEWLSSASHKGLPAFWAFLLSH
jgi:hypothetical protein